MRLPTARGEYALSFKHGSAMLYSPKVGSLRWRVSHAFHVMDDGQGSAKVATMAYDYQFQIPGGRELLAYHWHPDTSRITWPHLHLHTLTDPVDLSGGHFPTGWVALESVVRYAIMDLKIEIHHLSDQPRRRESKVLSELAEAIQTFAEWNPG